VLGLPRPQARGVLGEPFPWLISSEWLHYGYALLMIAGLFLLRPGFAGRAVSWWTVALVIQFWHHFEHLLLVQAQTGQYLAGAAVPTSVLQLVFPRVELHLFYNSVVFIPMVIAMYLHLRPNEWELAQMQCGCVAASDDRAPAAREPGAVVARLPAADSVLAAAPQEVVLTLSGNPDLARSNVSVRDSRGTLVDAGVLTSDGQAVLRRPVLIRTSGDFTAAYHVVLDDAVQLIGSWRFSVGTGRPPGSGRSGAGPDVARPEHDHGVDPVGAVVLLADAVVLAVVAVLLVVTPRRSPWTRNHRT
jgi:methionine-rich copper-binding protein CopC